MADSRPPFLHRLREGLRHAFGIESRAAAIPTAEEREIIERILAAVARRGLVGPTVLFLESMRSLNFVSAQAIHYFTPIVGMVVDRDALHLFARFLERRGSVEWLCGRLEAIECDAGAKPDEPRPQQRSDVTLVDPERADL
jgi:hypothetical protein